MDKVYVIGHKNPDTDTVVSAVAMAHYLNNVSKETEFVAAVTGEFNLETKFVFEKFNIQKPMLLENASGKKLYLVDHNEKTQMIDGGDVENVIGFIDHHKVNFQNSKPITIAVLPWGSTSTIVYDLLKEHKIETGKELKSGILCGMLSDTVILKSPTTTEHDKNYVEELSKELGIDYKELGMEMFKAKAQITEKTPEQIIKNDYKDFDFSGKKVGIGQIETPDLKEVESKLSDIIAKMKELKEKEGYHSILLMLTDIIEEGTKLVVVSDEVDKIASLYSTKIQNNLSDFIKGMMSRKKQVAPVLAEKL